ncbi:phage tail protein [Streptococcus pasteurianus]|uniref:phage tail protein n=1 Tax=Streptococcus pasteurianus TaxID=197614 RepID=UPI0036F328C0
MITFLNEKGVEHGALASIKITNAVNGERSLSGEIESGDYVLENIERGWRLRFDDEYYAVTYAKPVDEGTSTHVTFDAVHQFFWDFDKSSVHEQLNDGSHTFVTYLDFIFKDSGYTYTIEPLLKVYAFEKQSFGYKSRLKLFNDIITSSGVEFQVNGKVVRILEKTGTDLSTVVRKNFNMNELGIEKNISDFVTYQKGFGAWVDENDHTKGRLTVEYTSPLASVYGKLEAEPLVDERYTKADSMTAALKENVDNSYSISITLDMEDLTRAGYDYTQPTAGDYIMAINETLGFKEKIRIVSFTSEYDITGQLVKHEVTCNDIGAVKKLSASYTLAKEQAQNASDSIAQAVETANKALVSADGKSTVYFGNEFPKDEPKGTLHKGDSLYLTVGDTTKMYYWTGADWEELPIVNDVEAFKEQIADELKDVPDREEFEATITEKLATSKAELETQIDTAKTQAETNAKAYADEINQATAEVAEQASTAVNSLKSDLAKVQTDLTTVSNTANSAKTSASEAKQQLTTVANDLSTAKQDLQAQASQLTAQASAQSELTKRVSTVEETANGTKTTVSELSKTVDSNTQNITSVTARTKTVEDDLTSTKTTLSQVKTTANSANQKTATLETGLNGLNAKFETLKIGSRNYFKNSKSRKYYINSTEIQDVRTYIDDDFWQNDTRFTKNYVRMSFDIAFNPALPSNFKTYVHFSASPWYNSGGITFKGGTTALQHFDLKFDLSGAGNSYKTDNVFIRLNNTLPLNTAVSLENFNLYLSAVVEDYNQNEADIESKVAKYKQTADQNYASLQSNLQTLDGTVKQNKSEFDQTASQLKTSISAVEGKIPTTIGGRNYIQNYGLTTSGWKSVLSQWEFEIIPDNTSKSGQCLRATCTQSGAGGIHKVLIDLRGTEWQNKKMTYSIDVKASKSIQMNLGVEVFTESVQSFGVSTDWQRFSYSSTTNFRKSYSFVFYSVSNNNAWEVGDVVYLRDVQLEDGTIATAPKPAVEDTESDITKLNTTLTQTANGLEQLSTQVTSQGNTITSHTNSINSLSTGLSAKVSQTDFNTLSGRVTTAENNIIAKANELSSKITSVEGRIPTSVGGRNLVRGTANFSSGWAWNTKVATITDIIDKFNVYHGTSTGTDTASNNYDVRFDNALTVLPDTEYTLSFWVKGSGTIYSHFFPSCVAYGINSDGKTTTAADGFITHTLKSNWERYWITWKTLPTANGLKNVLPCRQVSTAKSEVWLYGVKLEKGNITTDWTPAPEDYDSKLATAQSEIKQTTDSIKASVSALDKSTVKSASLTINTDGIVMKAGKSTTDVANAIGSYFAVNQNAINLFSDKINVKGSMIVDGAITSTKIASKSINTAHLNGKIITADVISTGAITANAIKAGAVTTSAMSANSINGDRITAGTLDAAKIKAGSITASQIASGTITSAQIKTGTISAANIAAGAITTDKIAANSINSSKIVSSGITANVIKGGKLQSLSNATNFELDTGKLFYNNNNTGIFRVQANASTMGLKFSNTSITVSGTSRILSRVILGGDRRETTLDDGKWDQGGFSGIVVETINGIAANDHERADSLRVIADNIYFGHSYNKDVVTNTSAAGWKMETFSPNSTYTGHVVMKPFGINSRYADIVTGDVRLDNGDGSGYWVRGCIQVLRNCFQHFLNGGTSNDAKNAIRNALKDISGV